MRERRSGQALYGPYFRQGQPGGPPCRISWMEVLGRPSNGTAEEIFFVNAQDGATEVELLRAIVARLGIRWGCDTLGWWAASPVHGLGLRLSREDEVRTRPWAVWRQDDNGNRFLVSEGHSQAEAERIVAEYGAK